MLGLPMRLGQLRALARAIAAWDDAASQSANRSKGNLGGEKLPWPNPYPILDEAVARRIPHGRSPASSPWCSRGQKSPPDVLAALETIMAERAAPFLPLRT